MAELKLPVGSGNIITKYLRLCVAGKSGLQLSFHCTELTGPAPLWNGNGCLALLGPRLPGSCMFWKDLGVA